MSNKLEKLLDLMEYLKKYKVQTYLTIGKLLDNSEFYDCYAIIREEKGTGDIIFDMQFPSSDRKFIEAIKYDKLEMLDLTEEEFGDLENHLFKLKQTIIKG